MIKNIFNLKEKAKVTVGADYWKTAEALGIRSMKLCDGPFGVRYEDPNSNSSDRFNKHDSYPATCLPCGSAIGACWNEEIIYEAAAGIAREAKSFGIDVLLGPAMNHKRLPLGGRNFEYISEDPLLTGKLAAAYVRGVQSENVSACLKHYLANNSEFMRETINTIIDEKALREIYLRAFEIAVKESKPYCVMGAYNKLRGEYCCENKTVLTDILRDEWNFDGVVISDWRAVHDRAKALEAGCDLEMPFVSEKSAQDIVDAVNSGRLDEVVLDKTIERLKKLESLTRNKDGKPDYEQNYELSKKVAEESIVLLENNGVLPLRNGRKVAVIGGHAENPKLQGGGSARLNIRKVNGLLHQLKTCMPESEFIYSEGFTSGKQDEEKIRLAAETAARCDVALMIVASAEDDDREEHDRKSMKLESGVYNLIHAVSETETPIVLVIQNGAPVEMQFRDKCAAVLEMFLAGSGGEEALTEILCGKINPSGRLAETFPYKIEDCPAVNYKQNIEEVVYSESIFTGYRYYTTKKVKTLYPFGYGLSYTSFQYDRFSAERVNDTVNFTVYVTNTGEYDGKDVLQVYVRKPGSVLERELAAFKKIFVTSGETAKTEIAVPLQQISSFDTQLNRFATIKGNYTFILAKNAELNGLEINIQL